MKRDQQENGGGWGSLGILSRMTVRLWVSPFSLMNNIKKHSSSSFHSKHLCWVYFELEEVTLNCVASHANFCLMRIDELYGNAQSVSWLHGAFQTARLQRVLSSKEASHVLLADSEPGRQGVWRGDCAGFRGVGGLLGAPLCGWEVWSCSDRPQVWGFL